MAKKKPTVIPNEIYFTDEPRGETYKRLIDFALEQCSKFSIVWREDLGNKREENEIGKKLEPFIISDIISNSWPGTELFGGKANLCEYKLNIKTSNILLSTERLYQWKAPEYPEDLAFYTKNNSVWLGSVAHEYMGWLCKDSIVKSELENLLKFLYSNGIINKKYKV